MQKDTQASEGPHQIKSFFLLLTVLQTGNAANRLFYGGNHSYCFVLHRTGYDITEDIAYLGIICYNLSAIPRRSERVISSTAVLSSSGAFVCFVSLCIEFGYEGAIGASTS